MDSDRDSGEKGPETEAGKCSIVGCGEEVCELDWGLSPYCACHENDYGHEWAWCQIDGVNCPVWAEARGIICHCSLHGGADYVPRTTEEPSPEPSKPEPAPCPRCGLVRALCEFPPTCTRPALSGSAFCELHKCVTPGCGSKRERAFHHCAEHPEAA